MAFRDPDAQEGPDTESRAWLAALETSGAVGEKARRDLHLLLLKAARHAIRRNRDRVEEVRGGQLEALAHDSADRALAATRAKLDGYLGASRFTTWARKFAVRAVADCFPDLPAATESDLSCSQCFGVLDVYIDIEAEGGGAEAEAAMPRVGSHLDACPTCAEDHGSLLDLVASGPE